MQTRTPTQRAHRSTDPPTLRVTAFASPAIMAMSTPVGAQDPTRAIRVIVTRLVLLVALFYALLFIAVGLLAAPYATDSKPIILHVFDPSLPSFHMAEFAGFMGTMAYLLVAVLISPCVWKLAKRSAQCADFAVSVYIIHYLLTWYIDERGLPKAGAFYVVLVFCGVISSVLSERFAMREEMSEIPLDRFVAGKSKQGHGASGGGMGIGTSELQPSDAGTMRIEMV